MKVFPLVVSEEVKYSGQTTLRILEAEKRRTGCSVSADPRQNGRRTSSQLTGHMTSNSISNEPGGGNEAQRVFLTVVGILTAE